MGRFYAVYDKLNQALDEMPYDELGISVEVKEQVIHKFDSFPFIGLAFFFFFSNTNLSQFISCQKTQNRSAEKEYKNEILFFNSLISTFRQYTMLCCTN